VCNADHTTSVADHSLDGAHGRGPGGAATVDEAAPVQHTGHDGMKYRLVWACMGVAGAALLALAAADWFFYQSFLISLAWR
jgi:hypothetical protein